VEDATAALGPPWLRGAAPAAAPAAVVAAVVAAVAAVVAAAVTVSKGAMREGTLGAVGSTPCMRAE
jgi:hypothetical protein